MQVLPETHFYLNTAISRQTTWPLLTVSLHVHCAPATIWRTHNMAVNTVHRVFPLGELMWPCTFNRCNCWKKQLKDLPTVTWLSFRRCSLLFSACSWWDCEIKSSTVQPTRGPSCVCVCKVIVVVSLDQEILDTGECCHSSIQVTYWRVFLLECSCSSGQIATPDAQQQQRLEVCDAQYSEWSLWMISLVCIKCVLSSLEHYTNEKNSTVGHRYQIKVLGNKNEGIKMTQQSSRLPYLQVLYDCNEISLQSHLFS